MTAAKLEKEAKAVVEVKVPIFQRLEIIKEPKVNYQSLMNNYKGSREIILEDSLIIKVLSNEKWYLRLNNKNLNSTVLIKLSEQSQSEWQNLNLTTAKFKGEKGLQKLEFDLKFILDQSDRIVVDSLGLDLRHSLNPILY